MVIYDKQSIENMNINFDMLTQLYIQVFEA